MTEDNQNINIDLAPKTKLQVRDLNVSYGSVSAVRGINLDIEQKTITAFIGASGCGKSTFLRCFNRMNDDIDKCVVSGEILMDGYNVNADNVPVEILRSRVGMVFQKPNPFPKSIYDNIAYGPRIHGLVKSKKKLDALVKSCLEDVGLWDEVKDRLHKKGTDLSGGQQQRLCIARTIAIEPEIILMDEPCSALDPIATAKVEQMIIKLRKKYTIIIVTHSMSQAQRISDKTAFFHMGELVEYGDTKKVFENPTAERTQHYISGAFG